MHEKEWIAYLVGALLTLLWKFSRDRIRRSDLSWREFLIDWFFCPSLDNSVSWVTTVGLVWVVGVLYISRSIDWAAAAYIQSVPLHSSLAFMLGSLMEFSAPEITKWVVDLKFWPWKQA